MPNYAPYRNACGCSGSLWETVRLGDEHSNGIAGDSILAMVYTGSVYNPLGTGAQVAPYERYANNMPGDCEENNCDTTNLAICVPWIGTGLNQYNYTFPAPTSSLFWTGSNTKLTFQSDCRAKYFKNVQAIRFWHGTLPWTTHDEGGLDDVLCLQATTDLYGNSPGDEGYIATYNSEGFESYQPSPSTVKYTAVGYACSMTASSTDLYYGSTSYSYSSYGGNNVNALTGERTSSLVTSADESSSTLGTTHHCIAGAGYTYDGTTTKTYTHGMSSAIDANLLDYHSNAYPLFNGVPMDEAIADWNAGYPYSSLAPISSYNGYYSAASINTLDEYGNGEESGISIAFSRSATTVTWDFSSYGQTYVGGIQQSSTNYAFSGTAELSSPNNWGDVQLDGRGLMATWALNDDNIYPWRQDGSQNIAPLVVRDEAQGNVVPVLGFTPYFVDDERAAVTDANGNALYTTSIANPTNNDCSGIAYGSIGYSGPCSWIGTYAAVRAFDSSAWYFYYPAGDSGNATGLYRYALSGNVIGAPLPYNYQNQFCFQMVDWRSCVDGDGNTDWYVYGWGMTPPSYLPANCTNWTNAVQAAIAGLGAWECYALQAGTAVGSFAGYWGQKYVEVKQILPSYNFARPAAADKYSFDETKVYCFVSQASNVVTLTDTGGNPVTVMPDTSGYWGGSDVNGFYTIASFDSGASTVTLGSQVSTIPTSWVEDGFGKLRYPNCPAILGRQGIDGWTGSNPVTMSLETPQPYLCLMNSGSADYVDICDKNMSVLVANTRLTRADDSTYYVSASYVAGATWLVSHLLNDGTSSGVSSWQWNDTDPKGDYAIASWTIQPRSVQEPTRVNALIAGCASDSICASCNPVGTASLTVPATDISGFTQNGYCIKATPCCPNAICISPSNENFTNGVVYPFATIGSNVDERYGAMWVSQVIQSTNDLLWQIPHTLCTTTDSLTDDVTTAGNIIMVMDDGTCEPDSTAEDSGIVTHYYAHAPQVEARVTMPSGSPQLPPSVYIGWISPMTASLGDTSGDPLYPPIAGGGSLVGVFVDNACACVSGSGRFAGAYSIYDCNN